MIVTLATRWGRAVAASLAPRDAAADPLALAADSAAGGGGNRLHDLLARLPAPLAILRPHHWIKSTFVAAPLFFTPAAMSWSNVLAVALAMLCFCLASSAVYVVNDVADREADRAHPDKCRRPLAAGTLSLRTAVALLSAVALVGIGGAFALSPGFGLIVLAYVAINLAYSLALKHVAILDAMVITAGFVLRVVGGAEVTGITTSPWIILMTGLLAMFLAFAKRRDDVVRSLGRDHRRSLDGYNVPFLDAAQAIVAGALLVGYLIYVTSPDIMARFGTTKLFYTAPFVLFGILRYLQVTTVEERSGSPIAVLLTDLPIMLAIAGWLIVFAMLIH